MKKPIYLYKYVTGLTGINILKNLSIRFTQPNQLNDPFEMCVPIVTKELNENNYPEVLLKKHSDEEDGVETIRVQSSDYQNEVLDYISRLFGVACFSTNPKNLLMWSHYANSHQGICIQFILDEDFLKSCKCFKVKYSKARTILDTTELYNNFDFLIRQMSIKSRDWSYEKEYRFYSTLSNCNKIPNTEIYTRSFGIDNLGSIIMGYKCCPDDKKQIVEIMEAYQRSSSLYQARLSTDEFNLFYDDEIDIDCDYVAGFSSGTGKKKYCILGSNEVTIKDGHSVFYMRNGCENDDKQLSDFEYYLETGIKFFEEDKCFEAIECFKKCCKYKRIENSVLTSLMFYIASSYYKLEDFSEAILWYRRLIELNENYAIVYKKLAFAFAMRPHLGDVNSMLETYFVYCTRAVNAGTTEISLDILLFVAGMYYIYRHYDEAQLVCKRIKTLEIDNPTVNELEEKIKIVKEKQNSDPSYHIYQPVCLEDEDNGKKIICYSPNFAGLCTD